MSVEEAATTPRERRPARAVVVVGARTPARAVAAHTRVLADLVT
jgi:hypothetical protein